MTGLFQLAPLPVGGRNVIVSEHEALDKVQPRFFLPELDDHISGSERLLGSLRGTSRYELQKPSLNSPTKASPPSIVEAPRIETGMGEGDVDEQRTSIWDRAMKDPEPEAGPSRRVFEPIKTWDMDIASPLEGPTANPFLSEKPVSSFDAFLTSNEPSIHLPSLRTTAAIPVTDSKALLELMISATLGTTTTEHLTWNAKKARFLYGPQGGRPLGVEGVTAFSAIQRFLDIGTAIRRLEIIIDSQSTLLLTPTHHALLHALTTYLTFIKQRLTSAIEEGSAEHSANWNKWILMTKDVRQLAETLCEVMGWSLAGSTALALPPRASSLLTHLYSHLLASLSTASPSQQRSSASLALAYLLSRSSGPFLSLLHAWIGLADSAVQDEDTDETSQPWSDLGITRTPLRSSEGGWEYTFAPRRMPGFIPKEERRTLYEAGKSLRHLREASGGMHPLCSGDWGLAVKWSWGEESSRLSTDVRPHVRRVMKGVEHWRRSTKNRTAPLFDSISASKLRSSRASRKERKRIPHDLFNQLQSPQAPSVNQFLSTATEDPGGLTGETEVDRLWALFNQPPGTLLDSIPNKAPKLWAPTPLEELHTFIAHHSSPSHPLLPVDSPTLPIFITNHLLAPLLVHSTLISTSLVSLYLDDLRLLDHLDILQAFWLGGDVNFVERVSSALFGKEAAGAGEALGLGRRARTRARLGLAAEVEVNTGVRSRSIPQSRKDDKKEDGEWGIGLGLGLSERAKWPPGGSELAYALRTTLMNEHEKVLDRGPVWEEVEDRVSFAIKQLPEDDVSGRRAKWMNPQAIEALDFLFLSYSPSPCISVLLPSSLMLKYQSIHNLLLRLNRCEVVLKSMYWPVLHQSEAIDEPHQVGVDTRFDRPKSRRDDAASFDAKVAAGATARLIKSRNRQFNSLFPAETNIERKVQILRFRMSHFVTSLSRYVIDMGIGYKWDTMRRRLEKLNRRSPGLTRGEAGSDGGSRPSSPSHSQFGLGDESDTDHFDFDQEEGHDYSDHSSTDDDDDSDGERDGSRPGNIGQLQSIHSLVVYHHLTLDRILRACLLGPQAGQQVTYKVLTTLLSLVLDMGKVLVEVERGLKGWERGKEVVDVVQREWNEKEKVFLHALERLSLRTSGERRGDSGEEESRGEETEQDMKVLLSGEGAMSGGVHGDQADGQAGAIRGIEGKERNDLKELLITLRLGTGAWGPKGRGGRYKEERV